MWEQTVRTLANCLRVANHISKRMDFFPTLRKSMETLVKSRSKDPRGPVTFTLRALISTSTVIQKSYVTSQTYISRKTKRETTMEWITWNHAKVLISPQNDSIQYLPPSGISIVREARTVFILKVFQNTTIYKIKGVAGQFAGATIIIDQVTHKNAQGQFQKM